MDKNKKIILIGGIIEAAVLIFDLVLSIIVWTTLKSDPNWTTDQFVAANYQANRQFIGFFQTNTNAFFCIVCIPAFVLIALDFVYFAVTASKKETNLSDKQYAALKKKAEEEVRAEMMKELEEELINENEDKKEGAE